MPNEISAGLTILKDESGQPALCLVTGATGYIGGRLIVQLLEAGYRVRVLARNPQRLSTHTWINQVELVEGDANDQAALDAAMSGVSVAYYLLHALLVKGDFEQLERDMAYGFGAAAKRNKVGKIIYLGGIITPGQEASPHLQARVDTGRILAESGVPTFELRAGVVIGSGSASFEMLRYLTERLPIMTTPKWVKNRIQPIAVRDVLRYLVGSAGLTSKEAGIYEIAGPEVFTYADMMQAYAKVAGLRKRIIIPLPVLTPKLSSGWVGLVTPVPITLARRLVDSLKNEVVATDHRIRDLIPDPEGGLALVRIKEARVETRWSDASSPGTPSEPLPTDPDWAGGSLYKDIRITHTKDSISDVWKRVEAIGGDNGYSTASWAWELRGIMDRFVGGVGLRRGRRDPNHLEVGDALDFWRVEQVIPQKLLRLRAEMKLPGRAWLEFGLEVDPETEGTILTQVAIFAPKGLFGQIYWWAVWPMHGLVFPSMARSLARSNKVTKRA
jgi:uncharacterized protein YbjT (DUF2867 family)